MTFSIGGNKLTPLRTYLIISLMVKKVNFEKLLDIEAIIKLVIHLL